MRVLCSSWLHHSTAHDKQKYKNIVYSVGLFPGFCDFDNYFLTSLIQTCGAIYKLTYNTINAYVYVPNMCFAGYIELLQYCKENNFMQLHFFPKFKSKIECYC